MCHDSTQLLSCWHLNIASLWIYLLSITHCIHFFNQKYLFPTAIDSSTLTHILLLILITAFFTFIVKSCGHQWLFYMVLIKQVLDSTALAGALIISIANLSVILQPLVLMMPGGYKEFRARVQVMQVPFPVLPLIDFWEAAWFSSIRKQK